MNYVNNFQNISRAISTMKAIIITPKIAAIVLFLVFSLSFDQIFITKNKPIITISPIKTYFGI